MPDPQSQFLADVERELGAAGPAATDAFVDQLLDLGVMLPLRLCPEHIGSIVDDEGEEVFVVDVNNVCSDADSLAIASLLVSAVNTRGGFKERLDG